MLSTNDQHRRKKQTNVSHGPQQVNNHLKPCAGSRTEDIQSQQTKLYVGMTMAALKWTPEQRQRQAEAIRHSMPWLYSTGPITAAGKARVAQNGYRGGGWRTLCEAIKMLNQALREQRESIR